VFRFFTRFPALPGLAAERPLRDASFVMAAALTVLLVNLGGPPLFDDDEPRNAGCSLAMLDNADWVVPTFNGELRVHKPPLVNWVQMAGLTVAGRNEVGARLGSALLTTASCLVTWRIGCLLFSPAVGLLTGLTMAGCIWTAVGGRAATPDAPLVCATTCSLWLLAGGLQATGQLRLSTARGIAIGITSGLAVLAKGPVGFVVPASAAMLFALWQACDREPKAEQNWLTRALRELRGLRPVLVTAVTIAVALPWYVWVGLRTDWEWPRRFLLEHNVERFTTPLEGHSGSIAYYPLILLIGLFPWSIASLVAASHCVRNVWRERVPTSRAAQRLLLAWTVAWVGFFTLAGTKLPGYIWPAYPAAAGLAAAFWHAWSRAEARHDRWMPLAWCSLITAGIAFAIGGPLFISRSLPTESEAAIGWFLAAGVLTASGGLLTWLMQLERFALRRQWIPATLAVIGVGGTTLLATAASHTFAPLGPRDLVAGIPIDADIAVTSWGSPSGVFYATARQGADRVVSLSEPEEILSYLAEKPRAFLLVDPRFAERVLDQLPSNHAVLGSTASMPGAKQLMLIGPTARLAADREPDHVTTAHHAPPVRPL